MVQINDALEFFKFLKGRPNFLKAVESSKLRVHPSVNNKLIHITTPGCKCVPPGVELQEMAFSEIVDHLDDLCRECFEHVASVTVRTDANSALRVYANTFEAYSKLKPFPRGKVSSLNEALEALAAAPKFYEVQRDWLDLEEYKSSPQEHEALADIVLNDYFEEFKTFLALGQLTKASSGTREPFHAFIDAARKREEFDAFMNSCVQSIGASSEYRVLVRTREAKGFGGAPEAMRLTNQATSHLHFIVHKYMLGNASADWSLVQVPLAFVSFIDDHEYLSFEFEKADTMYSIEAKLSVDELNDLAGFYKLFENDESAPTPRQKLEKAHVSLKAMNA